VGLLMICVTVTGFPDESVETNMDVKADGAESVVDPCLSVVVTKTVDENVELEKTRIRSGRKLREGKE